MALRDRHQEHVEALTAQEAKEREAAERQAAEITGAVRAAVEAAMREMAADFGEDITFLPFGEGYQTYANVGGLVLVVQPLPEAQRQPLVVNPHKPREILGKFVVYVATYDKDARQLALKRLRVLQWIKLESVMRDLDDLPHYLDPWDSERIVFLLSEPAEVVFPRCEHPVVVASDDDAELTAAVTAGEPALAPCQLMLGHSGQHNPSPPSN